LIYVEKDVIHLTRGDDGEIVVPLETYDGEPYVMGEDEYLIFGVRERPIASSELLLEIQSEPGSNYIPFAHDDTVDIPIGFYSAEIQLMLSDGQRTTVWPLLSGSKRTSTENRRNFCLMTEVVYK
jgi:hypothetical protein